MVPDHLIDEAKLLIETLPPEGCERALRDALRILRKDRSAREMMIWKMPAKGLAAEAQAALRRCATLTEREAVLEAFFAEHGSKRLGYVMGDGGAEHPPKGAKGGIASLFK